MLPQPMRRFLKNPRTITLVAAIAVSIATTATMPSVTSAAGNFIVPQPCVTSPCYSGDGIEEGIREAERIAGITEKHPREAALAILRTVLSYMALVAVIVIVIAGIWLVVSGGEEEVKNKVKRMIIYVIVGLLIILFASAIVGFFTKVVPDRL